MSTGGWFTSIFGGKAANVLPTKNTSGKTAAPSNEAAVSVNVARPQQQLVPSRSTSPVANAKAANGAGASAPVMPNSKPKNANTVVLNASGEAMVGGRRNKSKSKKSKSKKSKKSKKTKKTNRTVKH
jgi:hypothetical protein